MLKSETPNVSVPNSQHEAGWIGHVRAASPVIAKGLHCCQIYTSKVDSIQCFFFSIIWYKHIRSQVPDPIDACKCRKLLSSS